MKKSLVLGSAALIASALYSCKDNSSFTIKGQVDHPEKVKKVYLLQADSSQVTIVDSADAKDGSFKFKRSSPYANLFKLRILENGSPKAPATPDQPSMPPADVFDLICKNGDEITFKTDMADTAHSYQVAGSDESEKIKEFNKISDVFNAKTVKLDNDYQQKADAIAHQYPDKAKQQPHIDSLLNVFRPVFQQIMIQYSDAILKFINDNKKSLAAFYAATSLDAMRYESSLVSYADAIKGQFNDNPAVGKFIKAMEYAKPVSVGHQAPDFTTTGLDGKPVKLSDYKGKYVMLDFWASWCGPCRAENPNVVKMYKEYHAKGLNILGISLDVEKKDWQQAINADKLTWNHASDLQRFEGPTERLYHIEAIPSNFIIDPAGKIVAKNITGTELEDFLKKTFSKTQ